MYDLLIADYSFREMHRQHPALNMPLTSWLLDSGSWLLSLLPILLLFACQFRLSAEAAANETIILWSTVSPSGTYALAQIKVISASSDEDKTSATGKPEEELSIVNLQTKEPVLDLPGVKATNFAPLDPLDASSTHWFCAWAPKEDHLLVVNPVDPLACLQIDLPEGHVSNVGSTLMASAIRVANKPKSRKPGYATRTPHLSFVDTHFISAGECYVTVRIDSGSSSDLRRVDLYFQIKAEGNSLVFERSEPYPNPDQPLGASILTGRQVERLYQVLRGVLDEGERQLLTMQQQSWLGGRELLANYEDRVTFAQSRIAELQQKLQEALKKKAAE